MTAPGTLAANALQTNVPKQHGQGAMNTERSGLQTAWFRTWRYQPDSTAHSPANQLF